MGINRCHNLASLTCRSLERRENISVRVISILLLILGVMSCADAENDAGGASATVQLDRDTRAVVSVSYGYTGAQVNDPSIERLFDSNTNTWWAAKDPECGVIRFNVTLEEPRYLMGVQLIFHGEILPETAGVALHYPGDEEDGGPVYFETQIEDNRQQTVDTAKQHYAHLLKAGSFRLDVMGCRPKVGKIEVSEIVFQISNQPTFRPELSASALIQQVKSLALYSSDGFWKFSPEGDGSERSVFALKDKYLSHLMYYGFSGNKEAEKLFLTYAPPGTASGEDASYMKSWYEKEKALRVQKPGKRGHPLANPPQVDNQRKGL